MKKQLAILTTLAVLLIVLSGCGQSFASGEIFDSSKVLIAEAKAGITEISYEDFRHKMESGELRILIDVREADEFEEGYINQPNEAYEYPYPETFTVNIPRGFLEFRIADCKYWDYDLWVEMPAKDEEIVLYSMTGERSALAAFTLQQMGYSKVLNLKGGYMKWLDPTASETEDSDKSSGG
ncbi:MAG: rhodanese-like domain-containing protein [Candidatus Cloacimonadales bacterium]|nr:rhodanese-like domain-containing protein [Candidatus Cloacimonadales bacterium]